MQEKNRTVGAHSNGVWHEPSRSPYEERYSGWLVNIVTGERTHTDARYAENERLAAEQRQQHVADSVGAALASGTVDMVNAPVSPAVGMGATVEVAEAGVVVQHA